MAQCFGVTGDSMVAKFSYSGKTAAPIASIAGNSPTVAASGLSGLLSATVIKMDNGVGPVLGNLTWVGKNNTPAKAFSVLLRCSFGQNTGLIGLWGWGSADKGEFNRVCLYYNGGVFSLRYFDNRAASQLNLTLSFTPTVNVLYDILCYSDGTTNANTTGININNGLASATGALSVARPTDDRENVIMLSLGSAANDVSNTRIVTDEFDIRDTVIAASAWPLVSGSGALSGAARTSKSLMTTFDGQLNSGAGAGNIRNGTTETIAGVVTTGTAAIPSAANVRAGTAVDATTGSLAVPAAGNVRSGTAVDAGTGTLVVPTLANTKIGVSGDGGTGTYDGSDRHSDPGISNVRSLTNYKSNSTSNNRTGTAAIPSPGDVRASTAVDATVGTLAIPARANVRSGTSVDNTTGTLVVPAASDVRNGTPVDAGTGTAVIPAASNVKSGVSVDATTGTLVSTDPGVGNVSKNVSYTIESVAKLGTRDTVTNVIKNATLTGQKLRATLRSAP